MGLDMYLERINRKATKYDDVDFWIEKEEENNTKLYQELKPFLVDRGGECYRYKSLSEEVGYWRKDNHIHNWFVQNVQEGIDDCAYHEVSAEQLERLKSVCKRLIDLYSSTKYTDKLNCPNCGSPLVNESCKYCGTNFQFLYNNNNTDCSGYAKILLPRVSGFLFGEQEYNERYYSSLKYTLGVMNEALKTDFEVYTVRYCSSW